MASRILAALHMLQGFSQPVKWKKEKCQIYSTLIENTNYMPNNVIFS